MSKESLYECHLSVDMSVILENILHYDSVVWKGLCKAERSGKSLDRSSCIDFGTLGGLHLHLLCATCPVVLDSFRIGTGSEAAMHRKTKLYRTRLRSEVFRDHALGMAPLGDVLHSFALPMAGGYLVAARREHQVSYEMSEEQRVVQTGEARTFL